MDISTLILIPFGLLFLVVGVLYQNEKFAKWNIKWGNSLRGTKSEITKQSLTAQKITGVVLIIAGVFAFFMAFYIPSLSNSLSY